MTLAFTGVTPQTVGDVYDLAMGPDLGTGTVNMVGYVLTPTGTWTEATNLQDEQHLVQVSSPFSTDRYGRFPKVSQGDWSGGERQLIFVTGNQYYQSSQLQTMIPGHLTCMGAYSVVTVANTVVGGGPRGVVAGSTSAYVIGGDVVTGISLNTLAQTTFTPPSGVTSMTEMLVLSDGIYVATNAGPYQLKASGPTWTQVTDESLVTLQGTSLAYAEGLLSYLIAGSTGGAMHTATYPFPGAGAGTAAYAGFEMEGNLLLIQSSSSGILIASGAHSVDQTQSWLYSFDGTTATFLGKLDGSIQASCYAQGSVYLLCYTPHVGNILGLPIIYQVSGTTISIFDDYRQVDADFLPQAQSGLGSLFTDGRYLYLATTGLNVKRYNLPGGAISDVGNPAAGGGDGFQRAGVALLDGSFVETNAVNPNSLYVFQAHPTPGVEAISDGWIISSWYDFDTPDVDKMFTQLEMTLNLPNPAVVGAVSVAFQINSPASPLVAVTSVSVEASGYGLTFYLPPGTLGSRIRFKVTLNHLYAPDVQSWSVSANLGRIWTATVSCRRNPQSRQGADPQKLTSTALLANIKDCYAEAMGNVILWIPDPTIDLAAVAAGDGPAVGVGQAAAVLQDYQWTTAPGVSPAYRAVAGISAIEGDVQLTLTEQLGGD